MSIQYKEVKVDVENLELGMHVVRLDIPWAESEFLLQGFVIQNGDDIAALRRQCDYVFVESKFEFEGRYASPIPNDRRKLTQGLSARGKPQARSAGKTRKQAQKLKGGRPSEKDKVTYCDSVTTEWEIKSASCAYTDAKVTVKKIMEEMRIGGKLDIQNAKRHVSSIVDSVLRNKDALAWLTKIKDKDDYTAEHALNVCILSATLARHLGHKESEIEKVALCGLLHDVGKSKIPSEILNKEGRFTDEEFEIMKQHTTYGRDLLLSMPDADRMAVEVAFAHHERMDGSGYPRGITETEIPYYAKLVSLTDCYDAITSTRCYDSARSSMEALDIIYKCKGIQFDEELALEFIKCIGVYPAGALVEFTNGEAGIVLATDESNKLRPRVMLVLDASKQKCEHKQVDLGELDKDEHGEVYLISKELPNGSYGIDIKDFLNSGLVNAFGKAEKKKSRFKLFSAK